MHCIDFAKTLSCQGSRCAEGQEREREESGAAMEWGSGGGAPNHPVYPTRLFVLAVDCTNHSHHGHRLPVQRLCPRRAAPSRRAHAPDQAPPLHPPARCTPDSRPPSPDRRGHHARGRAHAVRPRRRPRGHAHAAPPRRRGRGRALRHQPGLAARGEHKRGGADGSNSSARSRGAMCTSPRACWRSTSP